MKTRTTVSLNQEYLDSLKIIAVKQNSSLSKLVNKAIRKYLSQLKKSENNYAFFNQLDKIKKDIVSDKEEIQNYIKKGRL